ncbi:MAG: APC family permease [Actinomycetota bacterium]
MSSDAAVPPVGAAVGGGAEVAQTELQAGAIGFWGNMVQAVTHIAPGLNVLLGLTFIVSFAGVTAPIAYLLGGIICLGVAIVLTQLAKQFTGAGGYFLYISRTIGPRFGWLTTWLYFLYDPVAIGTVCAFTGSLVHDTLKAQYGWNIPWWVVFIVLVLCVTVFTLFGLALSVKVMLTLAAVEVGVFIALMISGLVSPGKGGFNFDSFNPSNIPSGNGLYLGIVFTILALSGFESVAPLGEETENPKRNLPLAIVGSTILVAVFYMFVNWGVLVGEGTANVKNFTSADQIFDLGRRLWGGAWIIILIAAVNSGLAVCIAIQNATTRVLFDMGRVKALPTILGKVHPRWRTPWNAIWLLTGVTLAIGLGLGGWLGPVKTFGMIGIMQTLGLIIVYSMGNIGAILFYGREKRDEFNIWLHAIVPILTTVALAWVFWKNVETLHPFSPKNAFDYSPLIVIIWTVVELAIVLYASRTGKEDWLKRAGESVQLRAETAAEAAHRPAL